MFEGREVRIRDVEAILLSDGRVRITLLPEEGDGRIIADMSLDQLITLKAQMDGIIDALILGAEEVEVVDEPDAS